MEKEEMRKTLIVIAMIVAFQAGGAKAEDTPADPVTMKLPRAMLQVIGNALQNAPYKDAAPILVELQRQLNEADKPAIGGGEGGGSATPNPKPSGASGRTSAPAPK